MTTTEHLPELPNLDDVPPFSEADAACFKEVREVLDRHGALQRFGLTLLHQHFQLADDEVLVESIDVEGRTLTLRPAKRAETENAVETSWRLDSASEIQRCVQSCSPRETGHSRQHMDM